jgi:hypothetical protein
MVRARDGNEAQYLSHAYVEAKRREKAGHEWRLPDGSRKVRFFELGKEVYA